jgi:hypothetical protein
MSSSSVSHALSGPAYIEQEELLAILHARRRGERSIKLQILDVRDDDYTGGERMGGCVELMETREKEEIIFDFFSSLYFRQMAVAKLPGAINVPSEGA